MVITKKAIVVLALSALLIIASVALLTLGGNKEMVVECENVPMENNSSSIVFRLIDVRGIDGKIESNQEGKGWKGDGSETSAIGNVNITITASSVWVDHGFKWTLSGASTINGKDTGKGSSTEVVVNLDDGTALVRHKDAAVGAGFSERPIGRVDISTGMDAFWKERKRAVLGR